MCHDLSALCVHEFVGGRGLNLLSSHGRVLVYISQHLDCTYRTIAAEIGLTERAVFQLVHDLEEAGMINRFRVGRRNHYEINEDAVVDHKIEAGHTVGALLRAMTSTPDPTD